MSNETKLTPGTRVVVRLSDAPSPEYIGGVVTGKLPHPAVRAAFAREGLTVHVRCDDGEESWFAPGEVRPV
jgi:hypothetical protein